MYYTHCHTIKSVVLHRVTPNIASSLYMWPVQGLCFRDKPISNATAVPILISVFSRLGHHVSKCTSTKFHTSTSCCKSQQSKFWAPVEQTPKWFYRNLHIQLHCRYDHTCKSMWCCDNVGGLGKHMKCHVLWILSIPFLPFLGIMSSSHQWTKLNDTSYDVLPYKEVRLGGDNQTGPHSGGQSPKLPFWEHELRKAFPFFISIYHHAVLAFSPCLNKQLMCLARMLCMLCCFITFSTYIR